MLSLIISGAVELAVIRGRCQLRPDLLEYANSVVDEAVNDRRGVRVRYSNGIELEVV